MSEPDFVIFNQHIDQRMRNTLPLSGSKEAGLASKDTGVCHLCTLRKRQGASNCFDTAT